MQHALRTQPSSLVFIAVLNVRTYHALHQNLRTSEAYHGPGRFVVGVDDRLGSVAPFDCRVLHWRMSVSIALGPVYIM